MYIFILKNEKQVGVYPLRGINTKGFLLNIQNYARIFVSLISSYYP